ncbi:molybdopterin-guanine dinucleotide biosynthesis protein A [Bordetella ansorpii]|uniref:Molybdenum cofactor guanylyltransferase n=1 Tax=Bordetella ansorpii TaxID=288768 RepID=A0A157PB82_9BORD|nr:molybdenum cofactor guanylyltransferase MobA [Bordetella ansorpii]SAI30721.1 molybdopterin-guanine dinucleotide biosynthesis protein A [Bordetella ansorpii]
MAERPSPAAGIGGLILAGGRGSRLGEADKGWVKLAGVPLVRRVALRLAPQVDGLLISANRNLERYAAIGRVLPDDEGLPAWSGPLAGIAAGLAGWPGQWLVTASCDTPFLPTDMASRLVQAAQTHGAPIAVACAQGRRHSVCMAVRTDQAGGLRDYLLAGDRKVELWQQRAGMIEVAFDDAAPQAFLNINTAEELAQAERYAAG